MTLNERITAYLDATPASIAGQHGDDQLFKVACALWNGWGLTEAEVVMWLVHYNRRAEPPWCATRLQYVAERAATVPHDKPRGYLRGPTHLPREKKLLPGKPMGTSISKTKLAIDAIEIPHTRLSNFPPPPNPVVDQTLFPPSVRKRNWDSRARELEKSMASMAKSYTGEQLDNLKLQGAIKTPEDESFYRAMLVTFDAKPRKLEFTKFDQEPAEKRKRKKIKTHTYDATHVHAYPWAMWDAISRFDTPEAAEVRLRNGLPEAYDEHEGSADQPSGA